MARSSGASRLRPDVRPQRRGFTGQTNGLCGAAAPGALFLVTGLRFGEVGLNVEVHTTEPTLGEEWEEAVEVSFTAPPDGVRLAGWESDGVELPVPPGSYRVRYCARGMDDGRDTDQLDEGADTRLRAADSYTTSLVLLDRDLVVALSELDDDTLRDIARGAALQAVTRAGVTGHPAVAPAVRALRAGGPLPAPFDEDCGWFSVADEMTTRTHVPHLPAFAPDGDPDDDAILEEPVQEVTALAALNAVSSADPLVAAVLAVESAAVVHGGDHYLAFMTGIRSRVEQAVQAVGEDR
ncbi:hypothetical protein ACFY36_50930 [Actinoplanes sp. NPDC000266]